MMATLMELIDARWHYAAVLLFCVAVTLPLELVLGARVYRRPQLALLAIVAASAPFVIWDNLAVRAGHWWFSKDHTLGLSVLTLPIEELSFYVVIPLCALLTFEGVQAVLRRFAGAPDVR